MQPTTVSSKLHCVCANAQRSACVRRKFDRRSLTRHRVICHGWGKLATDGFFDLSSLVATESSRKGAFDDLAYAIGSDAYADMNGWHIYLKDMSVESGGPKMHTVLAENLGEKVITSGLDEADVEDFLKKVPIKLGQGKEQVSLNAVLPSACVQDIFKACKQFEKDQ